MKSTSRIFGFSMVASLVLAAVISCKSATHHGTDSSEVEAAGGVDQFPKVPGYVVAASCKSSIEAFQIMKKANQTVVDNDQNGYHLDRRAESEMEPGSNSRKIVRKFKCKVVKDPKDTVNKFECNSVTGNSVAKFVKLGNNKSVRFFLRGSNPDEYGNESNDLQIINCDSTYGW